MSTLKGIFDGMYNPDLAPEELQLNNLIEGNREKSAEQAKASIEQRMRESTSAPATTPGQILGRAPKPLTPEEADAVDAKIEELLQRTGVLRGKITGIRNELHKQAAPQGGQEIEFKVNIAKKPTLRRAIQRVFGVKTDTITYSMYLEALAALRNLQSEEAEDYLEGRPQGDRDVQKRKD